MTDLSQSPVEIEDMILSHIMYEESFSRKVIPHIESKIFTDASVKIVFDEIHKYTQKYQSLPTKEALALGIEVRTDLDEDSVQAACAKMQECYTDYNSNKAIDLEWLTDTTEKYVQERAVYLAIMDSIEVIDDSDKPNSEIPEILNNALSVCFDAHVGHDYFNMAEDRYDFYHRDTPRIPFDIDMINKVLGGGIPKKTLTVLLASTGVGKTVNMCHMAAASVSAGRNTLYITMEMAEERISERIDANLLNVTMSELEEMSRKDYLAKMKVVEDSSPAELFVKEYPPVSAHAGHFESLLRELKIKKNFVPEIIFVDYLGICAAQRHAKGDNSNTTLKKISEELRAIAVTHDCALITGAQTNRGGYSDSDFGLDSAADSFGLTMTADVIFGLYTNDELKQSKQIIYSQLKNRFGDISVNRRFVVGLDFARMRMFDSNQAAITGNDDKDDGMPDYIKEAKKERLNGGFQGFTV